MSKVWIPADRFLALLDECGVTSAELDTSGVRSREALSLEAADRMLTKVGLTEWMHLPKEQGGLADLYFEEETFTPSWLPKAKAQLELARTHRRKAYAA